MKTSVASKDRCRPRRSSATVSPQRGVEHRGRLVGQDQFGAGDERSGEGDALALTPAERRREAVQELLRGLQTQILERSGNAGRPPGALRAGHGQGFGHDAADRQSGMQRLVGILEDDLHAAAQLAACRGAQPGERLPQNPPRSRPSARSGRPPGGRWCSSRPRCAPRAPLVPPAGTVKLTPRSAITPRPRGPYSTSTLRRRRVSLTRWPLCAYRGDRRSPSRSARHVRSPGRSRPRCHPRRPTRCRPRCCLRVETSSGAW